MYQLHIANKNYSSWSLRPWLLLKELNIAFDEILSPFTGGEGQNEFEEFCPSGLVPCLKHDDLTIWDSLAICEYVAEQNPWCWPSEIGARAWARSAACEMHSGFFALRSNCPMNVGVRVALHEITESLQKDIERLDALWQDGLKQFGGPFLAGGSFTIVDAFYAPVAFRVRTYDLPLSKASSDYVARILDLDSIKSWETAALSESWREEAHEKESAEAGILTKDFRTSD